MKSRIKFLYTSLYAGAVDVFNEKKFIKNYDIVSILERISAYTMFFLVRAVL